MNLYYHPAVKPSMEKQKSNPGEAFARRILIPYWFEIVSGIVVGLSMVLIFVRKVPVT